MFQNRYSSNSQRGQINESVNTDEHQSTQSPAAIIDEMETIFFTDPSGNIDPDLVDSYLARLDELVPLEETDDIEGVRETFKNKHALLIQDHFCDDNVVPIRKPKHSLRKVVVIAIAVFLSSVLGLVAYAENSNSSFAQWIDEIFSFSEIDHDDYHSIQEALDAYDITAVNMPEWLPVRYTLSEVSVDESDSATIITGIYANIDNSEDTLSISIKALPPQSTIIYEKNDSQVDVVDVMGTTYYVSQNTARRSILWDAGSYQCRITGAISDEEVSKIVNSIK